MKIYEVTWSCRIVGACAWLGNRPRSRYVKVQGFRNQDFTSHQDRADTRSATASTAAC